MGERPDTIPGWRKAMAKRALAWVVSMMLLAATVAAADISGKSKGQMEGADRELAFEFKVAGETLTGTVSGLLDRALEIKEGKVQGDTVSFWVMSEWQGEPVKLVYKGKLAGEEIRFTMGTEDGGWSTDLTVKRTS
jgi:hypothetical protein